MNTRRLLREAGFKYDSDSYNDDMPYWQTVDGEPHLVIPYSIQNNDAHLAYGSMPGMADAFFESIKASIDTLLEEGRGGSPKMMSVGLHCRLVGRPGRIRALERFIDYVRSFDRVWICRRIDIARHWQRQHPAPV